MLSNLVPGTFPSSTPAERPVAPIPAAGDPVKRIAELNELERARDTAAAIVVMFARGPIRLGEFAEPSMLRALREYDHAEYLLRVALGIYDPATGLPKFV
jgi:hypothetical protein